MFKRRRYKDVIERQLGLFASDDADAIEDVARALDRYNAADRDEAEELYGDYQLAIEAAAELLAEARDAYAATLNHPGEYVSEFNRAVTRAWPELGFAIESS